MCSSDLEGPDGLVHAHVQDAVPLAAVVTGELEDGRPQGADHRLVLAGAVQLDAGLAVGELGGDAGGGQLLAHGQRDLHDGGLVQVPSAGARPGNTTFY